MNNQIAILYLLLVLVVCSCNTRKEKEKTASKVLDKTDIPSEEKKMSKADTLVAEAIEAHGGELYENAYYGFTFRNKKYTFKNGNGSFTYTMSRAEDGDEFKYTLKNGTLSHTKNGTETELSPKDVTKYTEDVNSVVYFATLPHKLNDKAVNKTYVGNTAIKGQNYDMIAVTFDREGGGVDHEDEFLYWFNTKTKTMDYLAYNYETNDGGVRFRSAYNPRTVSGIRFQDYINYEAPIGTPLKDLPALYEKGQLNELSRIETEDVANLEK